jgi:hypothetical protein
MRPNRRIDQSTETKMIITLPTEVTVKEVPSIKIKTSTLEVISIQDVPNKKKIIANTKELGLVTLWESETYDRIGQWTDSDVETRLIELFLK